MKTEICENCKVEINEHDQAFVYNGHVVCKKCYEKFNKGGQDSPTTKDSLWDKRIWIVFALILCAIGGLIVGFLVGRTYSKYESRDSFYHNLNSIFGGVDKETSPADIDPRAKRILSVHSVLQRGESLDVQLTNISGKDIKSVLGYVLIFDQFGQRLKTLKLARYKLISVGETVVESWYYDVDSEFVDVRQMVSLLRSGQAEAQFIAQQVIYADGTRNKFRTVQGLE